MIPLALVSRVVAILVDAVSVSTRPLDGPWPDPSSQAKNRSAPTQRPNFFYPTFDVKLYNTANGTFWRHLHGTAASGPPKNTRLRRAEKPPVESGLQNDY